MNYDIVESFAQMVREKGIDKDVLGGILEEIFGLLVKKKYGEEAKFDVVVNMDRGDIEIFLEREIVEVVEDPNTQISLEEVNKKGNEDDLEVGEDFVEKIELASLGRRLVVLAKQSLNQKIRELEKEIKGETMTVIVKEVRKGNSGPVIIMSRSDNMFLRRLFEIEIPEIYDGIIEIKSIAREPGERAKIAVESQDARIDAVGACVGMKGVRIHAIVRELNNENIDVVSYSDDPIIFIQKSLAPAKLKKIELDEDEKKAVVTADSDQVSLIVGRNGVNIRLAMKLTGYEIEILREEKPFEEYEEDIELIDIKEELGADVYDILINHRYDTAIEVLTAGPEKLKEIEEFDDAKIEEILEIIKSQF